MGGSVVTAPHNVTTILLLPEEAAVLPPSENHCPEDVSEYVAAAPPAVEDVTAVMERSSYVSSVVLPFY